MMKNIYFQMEVDFDRWGSSQPRVKADPLVLWVLRRRRDDSFLQLPAMDVILLMAFFNFYTPKKYFHLARKKTWYIPQALLYLYIIQDNLSWIIPDFCMKWKK